MPSNESGRAEVYVQSFPGAGGKWQVSAAGGTDASWRADGREIFYRAPDQKIMAVDIGSGSDFQAGIPRPLFPGQIQTGTARNKYVATVRRPAFSPGRAPRARVHDADDDRRELERRARKVSGEEC